jgi:hypothetical protein
MVAGALPATENPEHGFRAATQKARPSFEAGLSIN